MNFGWFYCLATICERSGVTEGSSRFIIWKEVFAITIILSTWGRLLKWNKAFNKGNK